MLAVHFMRKNKTPGGSIVATASAAAVTPHETYPEYDGAKAAVSEWRLLKSLFPTDERAGLEFCAGYVSSVEDCWWPLR